MRAEKDAERTQRLLDEARARKGVPLRPPPEPHVEAQRAPDPPPVSPAPRPRPSRWRELRPHLITALVSAAASAVGTLATLAAAGML